MTTQFILYVADQHRSTVFYSAVLKKEPILDVPGMTEYQLNSNTKLGLMPESGINNILQPHTPHPASGNGIPRCELYIYVDSPKRSLEIALENGAILISNPQPRDWGDIVAYCADLDGHVLAFAAREGEVG